MDWLNEHKLPLGQWMRQLVDLLNDRAAFVFDWISDHLNLWIQGTIDLLANAPPALLIVSIAGLAGLLHRQWLLPLLSTLGLMLIVNLGYWQETLETLVLVGYATLLCTAIGIPLGIACAHRRWVYALVRPVLDLMQTIPTFVYLIPTLILFGLGLVPGLISTMIFALPAPVRLTYLGVSSVPKPLLEAGTAFGANRWQLLYKIELPHARLSIMTGVSQCIMLSLSMVVIAALVGADGLGKPVVRALNTVDIESGFEAGLAIVIVAILLDRLCRYPSRQLPTSNTP